MIKKIFTVFALLIFSLGVSGYIKPNVYQIDAEKNAIMHNNLGLNAICDGDYYAAIQEFRIAIALNPRTQATAVYYNNLGDAYMKLGFARQAQTCYENAIKQYSLNFLYYQNLVKSFKAQGVVRSKINLYKNKSEKESLSMVILGLLYIENGEKSRGIIKLDEFCMKEPDLLITSAIRNYLDGIVPKY